MKRSDFLRQGLGALGIAALAPSVFRSNTTVAQSLDPKKAKL
jgi:hypothetical protein